MAVAIAWGTAEAAGQRIGAENADGAHQVGKSYVMPVPFVEGLFGGLGKAKVDDVAEALLHVVIFVGFKKFQRTQDSEFIGTFGAEFILAAFAARDRKQQHAGAIASGFER